ncbi:MULTISPECIES: isoprenyl transferase [unclassified Jeotgalibaca]|uniref:isoprenyl transferase n=1 Tax=unclassified Jeotgalibaca TaxID=2621505 RepID=UPI003FD3F7C0
MAFFEKKKTYPFDKEGLIPSHIAIIMDGNGRWAKKRMMPRVFGHKEGMNTVKKIALHADKLGVKVLTLYAFSTENWKRPEEEVSFLMNLPIDFFDVFMPELIENNIRVNAIGWGEQLPASTKEKVMQAVDQTKDNTGMILNFALNYGSRQEITQVVKKAAEKVSSKEIDLDDITEDYISNELFTGQLGENRDPELMIRTSGEVRISNFLLWQIAYSELYFTEEFWPDFTAESLEKAIADYQHRHRRYGGL